MNSILPVSEGTANLIGTTASIATLLCIIPMCVAMFRPYEDEKRAHPSPITWGLWFFVGMVATTGMALGGAPFSAWILKLGLSLGPIIVAVIAWLRDEPLIANTVDWWSFAIGTAGLIVYILLYAGVVGPSDPYAAGVAAVIAAILVDIVAAWPTWYSAVHRSAPMSEIITFAIAWVSVSAVLLILPLPWEFLTWAVLTFLWFQMLSIIGTLWWGRIRHPYGNQLEVETA